MTIVVMELFHSIVLEHGGHCLTADVGERTREGNGLYSEMMASGGIKRNKAPGSAAALVCGLKLEPPGPRARVALTGLSAAERFRGEDGQDVLLSVDTLFRFTQAVFSRYASGRTTGIVMEYLSEISSERGVFLHNDGRARCSSTT